MMEDIGGTREEETHRIGQEGGRGGAIAVKITLPRLESVCAIPTSPIEVCVAHLGCGSVQRGDDKAWIIVRAHDFCLEHNPPGLRPGPGGIDQRIIETATGRRRLARGVGQGAPVVMETPRLLERRRGLTEQAGVAREAKNKIRPAVGGDHSDDLRGGTMTVPADEEVGAWPMGPQRGQQPDEDHGVVGSCGAGARAEGGCHQRVGGACENEQRQIPMVLLVMMIEGKLLLARSGIIGMSKIEPASRRWLGVAGTKVIPEGRRETREVLAVDLGFKP